MQVDAARPKSMGAQLKASMGGHSQGAAMTGFMCVIHSSSSRHYFSTDASLSVTGSMQIQTTRKKGKTTTTNCSGRANWTTKSIFN